jgi:hypothetical protein
VRGEKLAAFAVNEGGGRRGRALDHGDIAVKEKNILARRDGGFLDLHNDASVLHAVNVIFGVGGYAIAEKAVLAHAVLCVGREGVRKHLTLLKARTGVEDGIVAVDLRETRVLLSRRHCTATEKERQSEGEKEKKTKCAELCFFHKRILSLKKRIR